MDFETVPQRRRPRGVFLNQSTGQLVQNAALIAHHTGHSRDDFAVHNLTGVSLGNYPTQPGVSGTRASRSAFGLGAHRTRSADPHPPPSNETYPHNDRSGTASQKALLDLGEEQSPLQAWITRVHFRALLQAVWILQEVGRYDSDPPGGRSLFIDLNSGI